MKLTTILTILMGIITLSSLQADTLRETYVAKLSTRDHYNSKGKKLTNAAAIIRQDRANYHKFGKRDAGDQGDKFFNKASNRAILEAYLKRGKSTPGTLKSIVNGTPTIVVKIYRSDNGNDYVNVTVIN